MCWRIIAEISCGVYSWLRTRTTASPFSLGTMSYETLKVSVESSA